MTWLKIGSALLVVGPLLGCGKVDRHRNQGEGDGDGSSEDSGSTDTPLETPDSDSSDSADTDDACRRVVSLEGVTLDTPPPFDVVIVADNSESLSWSREDLAQGLSELVANVHGHAVRFHVLSPTQYGERSAEAINLETGEPLVRWRDPVSNVPYTGEVTQYVRSCIDDLGQEMVCPGYPLPNLAFEMEGRWEFVMPEPVAELDSDMSGEELNAQRQKVVDAILDLGISGSSDEQPLCTLTRYLKQPEVRLPERAVFLVIADEDDTNSADNCLGSYEFSRIASISSQREYGCTQNCDAYDYRMTRVASHNSLSFSCAPTDDLGELLPVDTWTSETVTLANTDSCGGTTSAACSADHLETAASRCPSGDTIQNCTWSCLENATEDVCGVVGTEGNVDFCSQSFKFGDTQYDNLLDFCATNQEGGGWGTCSRLGFTVNAGASFSTNGWIRDAMQANSAEDLVHLFHTDADRIFGTDNYFVESIVYEPGGACTPAAGQSYATELMKISSSPEQVYSICESYAPALTHVNDFAQGLLKTEYSVELDSRESIEGITVTSRDGTERQLLPEDYVYDEDTALLQIKSEALRSSDLTLEVEVVDPCAPIIR